MKSKHTLLSLLLLLLILSFTCVAAAETTTIRFNFRDTGTRRDTVAQWIAAFEELHPNIKVVWEPSDGDWDKLVVTMATGTAPDVTESYGSLNSVLANSNAALDLRSFVERDFTTADIKDFPPAVWDSLYMSYGSNAGMLVGLPHFLNIDITYFNTSAFRAAGIETPDQLEKKGEWTWQTLREISKKLTRKKDGEVSQWGFGVPTDNVGRMAQWIWGGGGDLFDQSDPTKFVGDQPESIVGPTLIQKMIWEDQTAPNRGRGKFEEWYAGKMAMLQDGCSNIFMRFEPTIGSDFAWNIAGIPEGPAGRSPMVSNDIFAIWAGTQHPEEAWEFIRFLASRQGQEIMTSTSGLVSARASAAPTYFRLNPKMNLQAITAQANDVRVDATTAFVGDASAIKITLRDLLRSTLEDNKEAYSSAIKAVKPVIERITEETYTQAR